MVKDLATNAGDKGSIPDLGRSHMLESVLESWENTATEARAPWSLCSPREVTTTRNPHTATREQPPPPQPEKSPRRSEDPAQPKMNKRIKLFKKKE